MGTRSESSVTERNLPRISKALRERGISLEGYEFSREETRRMILNDDV
jgi:hypothetical protein